MPATEKISGINHISINLDGAVGGDNSLIGIRVVPDGKKGNEVLGRTLKFGEVDSGESITVDVGEMLVFPPGSIQVTIHDLDRHNDPGPHGYKDISNTVWTWLRFGKTRPHTSLFYMLFAASRRLDVTNVLYDSILDEINDSSDEGFIKKRARWFKALGLAEQMCIALYRSYRIMTEICKALPTETVIPDDLEKLNRAIREFRNAFEHIEERAQGKIRDKDTSHEDAYSIFEQGDFASSGKLKYANHVLDLQNEVMPALITARQFLFEVAVQLTGGSQITYYEPITFFDAQSDRSQNNV